MQVMRNFRARRKRNFLQRISGKKPFCSYKKFVNFATLWKRDLSDISTGGFLFQKRCLSIPAARFRAKDG